MLNAAKHILKPVKTKISIKSRRLKDLCDALDLLASLGNAASKDGEKPKPFVLRNAGKNRCDLARDYRNLQNEYEVYKDGHRTLFAQSLEEQAKVHPNITQLVGQFAAKHELESLKIDNQMVDVDICQVPIADLDLDNNQIPINVIGHLMDTVIIEPE